MLQKQSDSLKQQIKKVKENICGRAGRIVDAAKRKGRSALYKITQVTGMKKKLAAIKDKVERAIDRVDNLEKAVDECHGQQREHGAEQMLEAAGQTVTQEMEKSR